MHDPAASGRSSLRWATPTGKWSASTPNMTGKMLFAGAKHSSRLWVSLLKSKRLEGTVAQTSYDHLPPTLVGGRGPAFIYLYLNG